ncbi:MAG: hypothetical protein Q9187_005954 [Circinaria calcarea]
MAHDTIRTPLRPVIRELVRTGVCQGPLRLLVDRIHVARLRGSGSAGREAYRLWLSDGEKLIQAILKREIHPFVTTGDISLGSYVDVTKYELARVQRTAGNGSILCLLIADFYPRGREENTRDDGLVYEQSPVEASHTPTSSAKGNKSVATIFDKISTAIPTGLDEHNSPGSTTSADDAVDLVPYYDENALAKATMANNEYTLEEERQPKRRKWINEERPSPLSSINSNANSQPNKAPKATQAELAIEIEPSVKPQSPENPRTISTPLKRILPVLRPLRVTPLVDLPRARAFRNKLYDVCAIICSTGENIVQRRGITDKRDFRLMDLSTKKKVQLSVFVDPLHFMPPPGTVALFRSVAFHEWDGGSLKAYHKNCGGRRWFIEDPIGIPDCDVDGLRALWEEVRLTEVSNPSIKLGYKIPGA